MSDQYIGALIGEDRREATAKAAQEIGAIIERLAQDHGVVIDSFAPGDHAFLAGAGARIVDPLIDIGIVAIEHGQKLEIDFKVNTETGEIMRVPVSVFSWGDK